MNDYNAMPAGPELDAAVAERVLGTVLTAITPAEVGRAVMGGLASNSPAFDRSRPDEISFRWNGAEHRLEYSESKFSYGGADGNDGYGLWFWELRYGQPWQSDVEAHVAAWRKRVPPYSTDIAAAWAIIVHLRDLWTAATEQWPERLDPRLGPDEEERYPRPFDDGMFFGELRRPADRQWPWALLYLTPVDICRAALAATAVQP